MNLTLGCKEQVGNEWIYILKNGTRLTREDWTSQVENHIRENNNQSILASLIQKVGNRSWFKMDTPEDFALQMYAAKYCTNIEIKARQVVKSKGQSKARDKHPKGEFGQISLM